MGGDLAFAVRTMRPGEVAIAIDWAAAEGWNPGLNDAACFECADAEGFLVAEIGGRPVGVISAVNYGGLFGFIGLYIVHPEFRGHAHGAALAARARQRLRGINTGLDGVLERVSDYERLGFRISHRNARYAGWSGERRPIPGIVPLGEVSWGAVCDYDRGCFPAARDEFLRRWTTQPGGAACGALDRGALRGYGVIRPCRKGYKIGPLFADNAEIAEDLFCSLCAAVAPGSEVFLDIPESNPAASRLTARHGMSKVFATARMYSGGDPDMDLSRVFGITTFELG